MVKQPFVSFQRIAFVGIGSCGQVSAEIMPAMKSKGGKFPQKMWHVMAPV